MIQDFQLLLEQLVFIFDQFNSVLFDTWYVALIVGIALCFFGGRIFRFSVFAFGFIVGAMVGLGIGDIVYQFWGGVVGSLVLGVLGGYAFLFLIRIVGFLVGVFFGGMVSVFLLGQSVWIIPITVVSGVCALLFLRYFVMAGTACWGAMLAIGGFFRFTHLPLQEHQLLVFASEVVLFVVGVGYQLLSARKRSNP